MLCEVIIGEPGVGKTAIVEGLARRIVDGDVPQALQDKEAQLERKREQERESERQRHATTHAIGLVHMHLLQYSCVHQYGNQGSQLHLMRRQLAIKHEDTRACQFLKTTFP